jgi:hypothetical protein
MAGIPGILLLLIRKKNEKVTRFLLTGPAESYFGFNHDASYIPFRDLFKAELKFRSGFNIIISAC